MNRSEALANGLGWFSIGLGMAEILAPDQVGRLIGIGENGRGRKMLRSYGFREVAAGVGILSRRRPAKWMWGRVAGDLVDLTSLGAAFGSRGANRAKLAAATAAVAGVTALDVFCSQQLTAESTAGRPMRVRKTIVIDREPADVYSFWRDFRNLARFMTFFESIEPTGDRRSHWKLKLPAGKSLEWDAEIHQDTPNESIAWRSSEGSAMENSGWVRFERAPGGRGTLVSLSVEYVGPGSAISAALAKFTGPVPGLGLEVSLRKLKQILETGEIARSDASLYVGPHAAQPPAEVPEMALSH